jgi:hypothetical protein
MIIPLIIQTIRRDPSRSVWIDDTPNLSRPDPSGADQIDAEHQATDLAVWPWRCWPMLHLAVPFPAGHASGIGRFGCRLSSRPLPQCPRAPAAVAWVSTVAAACGLRVSAGCVCGRRFGPPMSAGCADLAGTQGRPRDWTPPRCPLDVRDCGQVLVGRPLSVADTAAAP